MTRTIPVKYILRYRKFASIHGNACGYVYNDHVFVGGMVMTSTQPQ